jgi:hypothetical protein
VARRAHHLDHAVGQDMLETVQIKGRMHVHRPLSMDVPMHPRPRFVSLGQRSKHKHQNELSPKTNVNITDQSLRQEIHGQRVGVREQLCEGSALAERQRADIVS